MERYLIRDVCGIIQGYLGNRIRKHVSRGKEEWDKILVQITLQKHVVPGKQKWSQADTITDAYIDATPLYHKTFFVERCINVLACCPDDRPEKVEFLLLVAEEDEASYDTTEKVIELENGLVMPKPKYCHVDLNRMASFLERELSCDIQEVAISCVPEEFFTRRWCTNIGGHGYENALVFTYVIVNREIDDFDLEKHTACSTNHISQYWKKRRADDGCSLTPACNCLTCLQDRCHSSCMESVCPFRPFKRPKYS